ncbi:hypothetical protein GCM10020370_38560 [Paenibacillus hodogayensis]
MGEGIRVLRKTVTSLLYSVISPKINNHGAFQPADRILLAKGAEWNHQTILRVNAQNSRAAPLTAAPRRHTPFQPA